MQFRDEKRTAVIICTGESAGRIDLEPARNFTRIVVNDGYILAPDADALYAADIGWWRWHGPAVAKSFEGQKFCPDERTARQFGAIYIGLRREPGLSRRKDMIYTGGEVGNSGAQAINLATIHGARRIVLVGMDMGGSHFFGEHPKQFRVDSEFKQMVRSMSAMACELHRDGIEVINCSDVSNIAYWPRGKSIPTD